MAEKKLDSFILTIGSSNDMQHIACEAVMIRSMPSNLDAIYVAVNTDAAEGKGWPLEVGDSVPLKIHSLKQLSFHFVNEADKVALLYEAETEARNF